MAERSVIWSGLGVVLLAGASLALPACSPAGEGGQAQATAAPAASASQAGEAGEGGGEAGEMGGEAGAASAFVGLSPQASASLRVRQLEGFLLAAEALHQAGGAPGDVSILIAQGLLEVHRPAEAAFSAGPTAAVKPAYDAVVAALDGGAPKAETEKAFAAARAASAAAAAGEDPKSQITGLLAIAAGLYEGVNRGGAIDPIEYQHALGAALAAQTVLPATASALNARDAARYDQTVSDMQALLAVWPGPVAPEKPAALADVLAARARVELSLSGL
jgi:hypothetical protein